MRGADAPPGSDAVATRAGRSPARADEELMACVAAGDRAALERLYNLYAPLLMGVAARMLGGEREAQDLVHDVVLEAWVHAADFDAAKGSLRSWLLLRLRSRALDRLGRVDAQRTVTIDDAEDACLLAAFSPAVEHADRISIREAIDALDADVRNALELTYFRGMTADAIAQQTGVPVGTVRSRLARGIRVLRGALGVVEEDEGTMP
jgi:RNA polymerase sigma-70 factor (ECF subfamily)